MHFDKRGRDDQPSPQPVRFLILKPGTRTTVVWLASWSKNIVSKIICLAFKIIILVIFYAAKQYKAGNKNKPSAADACSWQLKRLNKMPVRPFGEGRAGTGTGFATLTLSFPFGEVK